MYNFKCNSFGMFVAQKRQRNQFAYQIAAQDTVIVIKESSVADLNATVHLGITIGS
jgi:ribosomal protein S11